MTSAKDPKATETEAETTEATTGNMSAEEAAEVGYATQTAKSEGTLEGAPATETTGGTNAPSPVEQQMAAAKQMADLAQAQAEQTAATESPDPKAKADDKGVNPVATPATSPGGPGPSVGQPGPGPNPGPDKPGF